MDVCWASVGPCYDADQTSTTVLSAIRRPGDSPAIVVGATLSRSDWDADMRDYLEANRAEAMFTDVVPVTGVDQIRVTFSEDVFVGRSSIRIPGKDNRNLAIRDFFYDAESATAVWTLAESLPAGSVTVRLDGVVDFQGNLLDGDANGQPGGAFWVRFDSLPGDVNGDGRVDRADHLLVQAHPAATLGHSRYVLALDVDGNARIDDRDLDAVWRLDGYQSAQLAASSVDRRQQRRRGFRSDGSRGSAGPGQIPDWPADHVGRRRLER